MFASTCAFPWISPCKDEADDATGAKEWSDELTPTTTQSERSTTSCVFSVDEDVETTFVTEEEEADEIPVEGRVPRIGPSISLQALGGKCVASRRASTTTSSNVRDTDAGLNNSLRKDTLFILDWDDTILPTTWLRLEGLDIDAGPTISQQQRSELGQVAHAAVETIRRAKSLGTVVLVTNAERGWVEHSCQRFLPALLPVIEGVRIVSARTAHESPFCSSPLAWKVLTFEAEIARMYGAQSLRDPKRRKNIFSLGDGPHERQALTRVTAWLPSCWAKTLKFFQRPEIGQLARQHEHLADCLMELVQHKGDLDRGVDV